MTPQAAVVNDFSIQVATANGSGSQSANMILMRALFHMGIPVSGKNLFPSNIQGLPTWFTIRVSKDGYIARKKELDIVVAMNPETATRDIAEMRPNTVLVLNQDIPVGPIPENLVVYSVPFGKIVAACCPDIRLRKLVTNIIYVGVLAQLLGIDLKSVEHAMNKQFKGKAKAIALNLTAMKAGYEYATQNLPKKDAFRVEPMDKTKGKIVIEGNAAGAIGSMFAGCSVVAWYPITPSSSLCEAAIDYFERFRKDANGLRDYAIVQMEDELASLGVVLGAGWAGARSMTSTSGPGISLMSEFAGLGYFAEIPAVVWDIQRVGPSTGLPTRTAQGDVLKAYTLSHGDTKHIVLLPCSVEECYEFGMTSFDIAEKMQTPVFVLSDLDIGMNYWMSDPFPYPTKPLERGKTYGKEDLDKLKAAGKKFERYRDVDGDGVPYRTLPGTPHDMAGYFTRGSGHNEAAAYTERPEDYKNLVDRLARKFETARKVVPGPELHEEKAGTTQKVGLIAYGSTHHAMGESRDQMRKEGGLVFDYLRLRALPINQSVRDFIAKHDRTYVIEQNRDGQMCDILRLEVGADATKLRSIRHYNGLPIDARFITDAITAEEKKGTPKPAAPAQQMKVGAQ